MNFQQRVTNWLSYCFGYAQSRSKQDRIHRFIEEALELAQAAGCPKADIEALLNHVYAKEPSNVANEVGDVMLTLAGVANAYSCDADACGERSLQKVWEKCEQIRAKQASKDPNSPLPGHGA